MFDIGWSELLVIGTVALVVVGPQDLPRMFHTLGRVTARARSMAREFSRAMEEAADASGVKDVAEDLEDLRDLGKGRGKGLDAFERAAERFEKWEPKLPGSGTAAAPDPAAPPPDVASAGGAPIAASAAGAPIAASAAGAPPADARPARPVPAHPEAPEA